MLQLKDITKSYTTGDFKQVALNKLNLNLRRKEFVAIFGPSGSGKTTCLNVIGGLDKYDSGDLVINGKSTKNFKDSEWDAYRNNSDGRVRHGHQRADHGLDQGNCQRQARHYGHAQHRTGRAIR